MRAPSRREARRASAQVGACLVFFVIDRAVAWLAIDTRAAAALLSPAGASFEALAIALAFLLARLSFAIVFCWTLAWLASAGVRWVVESSPTTEGATRRAVPRSGGRCAIETGPSDA